MVQYIEFEETIETFDGLRVSGYILEQLFRSTKTAMREIFCGKNLKDSYLKSGFHHLYHFGTIETHDPALVPRIS